MGFWLSLQKNLGNKTYVLSKGIHQRLICATLHMLRNWGMQNRVYGLQYKMTNLMDHLWSDASQSKINLYDVFTVPFYDSNTGVLQHNRCYLTQFPINFSSSLLAYLTFRINLSKLCGLFSSLQEKEGSFLKCRWKSILPIRVHLNLWL